MIMVANSQIGGEWPSRYPGFFLGEIVWPAGFRSRPLPRFAPHKKRLHRRWRDPQALGNRNGRNKRMDFPATQGSASGLVPSRSNDSNQYGGLLMDRS